MLKPLPMRVAIVLSSLLLGACASGSEGGYPSLATRPGERVTGTLQPVAPPPPPAATAATGDRLARLRGQALAAHRKFEERRGEAAAKSEAARCAAVASES